MFKYILIFDLVLLALIVVLKIVQRVMTARRLKKCYNEALKEKGVDNGRISNVSK